MPPSQTKYDSIAAQVKDGRVRVAAEYQFGQNENSLYDSIQDYIYKCWESLPESVASTWSENYKTCLPIPVNRILPNSSVTIDLLPEQRIQQLYAAEGARIGYHGTAPSLAPNIILQGLLPTYGAGEEDMKAKFDVQGIRDRMPLCYVAPATEDEKTSHRGWKCATGYPCQQWSPKSGLLAAASAKLCVQLQHKRPRLHSARHTRETRRTVCLASPNLIA